MALDPINKELESRENTGAISKVDDSKWTLPTVYVKENNKIRVCADFSTRLNDSLQNYNYQVRKKFSRGKFCSKLDLSDAYQQILVEKECSKLPTINTHKGLLKIRRGRNRMKKGCRNHTKY